MAETLCIVHFLVTIKPHSTDRKASGLRLRQMSPKSTMRRFTRFPPIGSIINQSFYLLPKSKNMYAYNRNLRRTATDEHGQLLTLDPFPFWVAAEQKGGQG